MAHPPGVAAAGGHHGAARWFCLLALLVLGLATGARAGTIYVDPAAPGPARDGRAWATAFAGVQDAVRVAQPGDTVAVAQGSYAEEIVLKESVRLRGGYAGFADPGALPDPDLYPAVLSGLGGPSPVVYAPPGLSAATRVEGFWINPGDLTTTGIFCNQSAPTIAGNVIRGGYMAIACSTGSLAVLVGNVIADSEFGVHCSGSSPVIAGNLVTGCIYAVHTGKNSSPVITNNTLADNATGLDFFTGAPRVENNVVARNETGVYVALGGAPSLAYNCVSDNTEDFSGLDDPTGTAGNIAQTPGFVDAQAANYRLSALSPCIDAGNDDAPSIPDTDLDALPRRRGDRVDIGAYEWAPVATGPLAADALQITGGLKPAAPSDMPPLNVEPPGVIDIADAVRLNRR